MKKVILLMVMLLVAGALYAGEGKSCDRSQAGKAVQLTGTIDGEDVTIELERQDDSNVVVEVATDDKDFAQRIVQEIVEFSGSPMVTPADTASVMPSGVSPSPADTTSP